jgi:hypothetical protein
MNEIVQSVASKPAQKLCQTGRLQCHKIVPPYIHQTQIQLQSFKKMCCNTSKKIFIDSFNSLIRIQSISSQLTCEKWLKKRSTLVEFQFYCTVNWRTTCHTIRSCFIVGGWQHPNFRKWTPLVDPDTWTFQLLFQTPYIRATATARPVETRAASSNVQRIFTNRTTLLSYANELSMPRPMPNVNPLCRRCSVNDWPSYYFGGVANLETICMSKSLHERTELMHQS